MFVRTFMQRRRGFIVMGACVLFIISCMTMVMRNADRQRTASLLRAQIQPAHASSVPVRLQIPSLDIDAPVIPVGLTASKAMDVPNDPHTVGWFAPGYVPGSTGNAVFSGHLDTVLGTPGIFWNLQYIKEGDMIIVTTQSGQTLHFRVKKQEVYAYNNAPMKKIFGTGSHASLNIITCNGIWKRTTYDKRLVVYSELMTNSQ